MSKSPEEMVREFEMPMKRLSDVNTDLDSRPLACGFPSLEESLFLRFRQPDLVIVGGRPGSGKTAWLGQVALNTSRMTGPVLLFSLEMSNSQLKNRLLALETNKAVDEIKKLPLNQQAKLEERLADAHLFIDDSPGIDIATLCSRSIAATREHGIEAVCVDYVQIVQTARSRSRKEEIARVCEQLKYLAKELKRPVIALAQMSRDYEKRIADSDSPNEIKPVMSDLADASDIEKWADMIAFIHRPSMYDPNCRPGEADFVVVKNRHGESQTASMEFSKHITKFFDRGSL
jgi:replicative DNA helicase